MGGDSGGPSVDASNLKHREVVCTRPIHHTVGCAVRAMAPTHMQVAFRTNSLHWPWLHWPKSSDTRVPMAPASATKYRPLLFEYFAKREVDALRTSQWLLTGGCCRVGAVLVQSAETPVGVGVSQRWVADWLKYVHVLHCCLWAVSRLIGFQLSCHGGMVSVCPAWGRLCLRSKRA